MISRSGRVMKPCEEEPKNDSQSRARCVAGAFREMLTLFEQTKPGSLNIITVANQFKLQNRRVYDFFSVCSAVNACSPVCHGIVTWRGLDETKRKFEEEYIKFEIESLTVQFDQWFAVGANPNLDTLATKIIVLLYALAGRAVNLHGMSHFLIPQKCARKSVERRMYLVLGIFEIMGYVEHHSRSGEYRLAFDISDTVSKAMDAKRRHASENLYPTATESLMTKLDGAYVTNLREKRMSIFQSASKH